MPSLLILPPQCLHHDTDNRATLITGLLWTILTASGAKLSNTVSYIACPLRELCKNSIYFRLNTVFSNIWFSNECHSIYWWFFFYECPIIVLFDCDSGTLFNAVVSSPGATMTVPPVFTTAVSHLSATRTLSTVLCSLLQSPMRIPPVWVMLHPALLSPVVCNDGTKGTKLYCCLVISATTHNTVSFYASEIMALLLLLCMAWHFHFQWKCLNDNASGTTLHNTKMIATMIVPVVPQIPRTRLIGMTSWSPSRINLRLDPLEKVVKELQVSGPLA